MCCYVVDCVCVCVFTEEEESEELSEAPEDHSTEEDESEYGWAHIRTTYVVCMYVLSYCKYVVVCSYVHVSV